MPLPEPTITRLPLYLRCLDRLHESGEVAVDSQTLAQMAGVGAHNLRKDLAYLGNLGTRGSGYDIVHLRETISSILGADRTWNVAICGVGNLGTAFAKYLSSTQDRFMLTHLFDVDPQKLDTTVAGIRVVHNDQMGARLIEGGPHLGIISTPPESALDVARLLASYGVRSMLNFAPVHIDLGPANLVRNVDVGLHLLMLSYHEML